MLPLRRVEIQKSYGCYNRKPVFAWKTTQFQPACGKRSQTRVCACVLCGHVFSKSMLPISVPQSPPMRTFLIVLVIAPYTFHTRRARASFYWTSHHQRSSHPAHPTPTPPFTSDAWAPEHSHPTSYTKGQPTYNESLSHIWTVAHTNNSITNYISLHCDCTVYLCKLRCMLGWRVSECVCVCICVWRLLCGLCGGYTHHRDAKRRGRLGTDGGCFSQTVRKYKMFMTAARHRERASAIGATVNTHTPAQSAQPQTTTCGTHTHTHTSTKTRVSHSSEIACTYSGRHCIRNKAIQVTSKQLA